MNDKQVNTKSQLYYFLGSDQLVIKIVYEGDEKFVLCEVVKGCSINHDAVVGDCYLEYKRLEVLQELAKSGTSVFVPMSALDEVGMSNKAFNVGK